MTVSPGSGEMCQTAPAFAGTIILTDGFSFRFAASNPVIGKPWVYIDGMGLNSKKEMEEGQSWDISSRAMIHTFTVERRADSNVKRFLFALD